MAFLARFAFSVALIFVAAAPSAEESAAVSGPDIDKADHVFVDKSERRLDLLRDGAVIASFP